MASLIEEKDNQDNYMKIGEFVTEMNGHGHVLHCLASRCGQAGKKAYQKAIVL